MSDGEFKAWDDDEDKVEGKTGAAAPTSDATQALLTLSNGTAESIEEQQQERIRQIFRCAMVSANTVHVLV